MKKVSLILSAVLLIVCCFGTFGCGKLDVVYLPDDAFIPTQEGDPNAKITIVQYDWDGHGTSYKNITGASADRIISLLSQLQPTGDVQHAFSEELEMPKHGETCHLPVPRGTKWVEADGKIYRIDPELTEIALVERHLGEGTVLDSDEKCLDEIGNAFWYWPKDYWWGEYQGGVLTLEHKYAANTTVTIKVKKMNIVNDHHSKNSITVELISTIDQTVTLSLQSQQSSDNLGSYGSKTVELINGKSETVELTFDGFYKNKYDVHLMAGNTRMTIVVDPR